MMMVDGFKWKNIVVYGDIIVKNLVGIYICGGRK